MSRRTWAVEEKLSIVLEMLKGQESITSLCHRHGVAMSQAYRWRDAFLERGKFGLRDQLSQQFKEVLLAMVVPELLVSVPPNIAAAGSGDYVLQEVPGTS